MAPRAAAAVVALGDSLTDGLQARPPGILELRTGIDADARWPDVLARRLRSRGQPMSVLNAGISGNRVLRDATDGGQADTNGPSALGIAWTPTSSSRRGARTAIVWEGINDLALAPSATAAQLVAGYEELIGRLQAPGCACCTRRSTPAGGAEGEHGTPATEAKRQAVNAWIRRTSPADEVLDLDAVVRDPGASREAATRPRRRRSAAPQHCGLHASATRSRSARSARPRARPRADAVAAPRRAGERGAPGAPIPARRSAARSSAWRSGARAPTRARARIRLRFARRGRVTVVATAAGQRASAQSASRVAEAQTTTGPGGRRQCSGAVASSAT